MEVRGPASAEGWTVAGQLGLEEDLSRHSTVGRTEV